MNISYKNMNYENILIPIAKVRGHLSLSSGSKAIIILVHGSNSSMLSARNLLIARNLNNNGISTLLVDLLTENEKIQEYEYRNLNFNIEFLTNRLILITNWVLRNPKTKNLSIGYIGSSTGATAALIASTRISKIVAIVCRGGRTDLIDEQILNRVKAHVLLIVGERDLNAIASNKKFYKKLNKVGSKRMVIVSAASHLFEESGKIEEVSNILNEWLITKLLSDVDNNEYPFSKKPNISRLFWIKSLFQFKFVDRYSAASLLIDLLHKYRNKDNVSFLGIPRGGVMMADLVSTKLSAGTYSIILSQRLINPFYPEETVGAIFQDGSVCLVPSSKTISPKLLQLEISRQRQSLEKKIKFYKIDAEEYDLRNRDIIIIDDGCYTGATVLGAYKWIRSFEPNKIILATPVISRPALQQLKGKLDKIEYLRSPKYVSSIDDYYINFRPPTENEILRLLKQR
jgi:putative phosphoribosyl transferase